MKLSVIIPAYNEENYIGKTLQAISAQDYADFEVIVVDNGSTDRTADIARSFANTKVISERQRGTSAARESGRREATGDIVVTLDADSIPPIDWLSRGAAYFSDQKTVGVSGAQIYYDSGTFLRFGTLLIQRTFYVAASYIVQWFGVGAVMIGGNSFMRASTLADIGGFDIRFIFWGDDTDIAKRLATRGKVVFDPSLSVLVSARRLKHEGAIRTLSRYLFHFFRIIFSNKYRQPPIPVE
ncbi:MAG: glycosyltransferase family 2 protein [Patescibacteria group bacterium]|nr:glycosyltransferase family 2 protein [Patescibacteria group bacterium]